MQLIAFSTRLDPELLCYMLSRPAGKTDANAAAANTVYGRNVSRFYGYEDAANAFCRRRREMVHSFFTPKQK
jgi:hypothetical protein